MLAASKDAPWWVQEVAFRPLPAYPGNVPAVVLLDDRRVVVDSAGVMTITTRHAVKLLTREGRTEAEGREYYVKGGRQVKQLHAWLVAPDGFTKTFDKGSVEDLGSFDDAELYDDMRFRRVSADNAAVGSVFAYESQVEEKALFAQDEYDFQSDLPCVQARYVLTLPAGWSVKAAIFNHAPIPVQQDGSSYTWELGSLPFRDSEQQAPDINGSTPRLGVTFQPAGATASIGLNSWADVSRWQTDIAAGQDALTPEMSAKALQLTKGLGTEYDRVRAIGYYVQMLRYVAIEMGTAHGGGYKPHAAAVVLRNQYGDCKDKANLMRALLKAVGIQSYLVAIYSGDRTFVQNDWPSPSQFNHMILAARVSSATNSPTVMSTPLGRLLFFDPTDDTTPMGDLPWYEQGSLALLCAGDMGQIVTIPATAPEANLIDQRIEASLSPSGAMSAVLSTVASGQAACKERATLSASTPEAYKTLKQQYLNYRAQPALIGKFETVDSFERNSFTLKAEFASRSYGQVMQQRLIVFSPSLAEPDVPQFSLSAQRTQPIVLRAGVYRKRVCVKLPPGFSVDEMPSAASAESAFGKFSLTYQQRPGELVLEEEIRVEGVTLPANEYPRVKKFFDDVRGADNQNAVLVKE